MATRRAHALNRKDNVAVAYETLSPGDEVRVEVKGGQAFTVRATEEIPFGFKIAITDIPREGRVIKYGEVMGIATADIGKGTQVHVHNVGGARAQAKNP